VKDKSKIIGLKLELSKCSHGNLHVTNVEPIHESAVVYNAPDADDILTSSHVGWSRAYAASWDRVFGAGMTAEDTN